MSIGDIIGVPGAGGHPRRNEPGDQPRPVWLTREQRDAMQGASKRWPLLWDAVDAWDAAPADPTEAAIATICARYPDTVWTGRYKLDAMAVLRALGMPS